MEKLIFPQLSGAKWLSYIQLNKYVELLREDFDDHTPDHPFLDPQLMGEWIKLLHKTLGYDYSWGGYLEEREDLLDGTYLPSGHRTHLGVDFWVPVDTLVHLPKDGKLVQSRYDKDRDGGWGGQVIFDIDGMYVIFGHLTDIAGTVGTLYAADSVIGRVADIDGSGGWYPHLHLQCMRKFDSEVDGYSHQYKNIGVDFPDPITFLKEACHVVG